MPANFAVEVTQNKELWSATFGPFTSELKPLSVNNVMPSFGVAGNWRGTWTPSILSWSCLNAGFVRFLTVDLIKGLYTRVRNTWIKRGTETSSECCLWSRFWTRDSIFSFCSTLSIHFWDNCPPLLFIFYVSDSSSANHHCHQCGKQYKREHDMARHIRTVHIGKKAHKCVVGRCDARFEESWRLKRHFDEVHLNLKPFRCRYCLVSFGRSERRKAHEMKTHPNRRKTWSL